MKRVLFVSDNFLDGGLETRILEQIEVYNEHGIECFLLCGKLNKKHKNHFKEVKEGFSFYPETLTLIARDLLNQAEDIASFCKQHKIDFIDCQPFWCALPAILAANKMKIPISLTLHGRPSIGFIGKCYFGLDAIYELLFSFGLDQKIVVSEQLGHSLRSKDEKECVVVRNGIDFGKLPSEKRKKGIKRGEWAIVSRIDEMKGKIITDSLPFLVRVKGVKKIFVIGDGPYLETMKSWINDNKLSKNVFCVGWKESPINYIRNEGIYGVMGLGRVVVEASALKVPSVILGFGGVSDILSKENFPYYLTNNFVSYEKKDEAEIRGMFSDLAENPNNYDVSDLVREQLDAKKIWKQHILRVKKIKKRSKKEVKIISRFLKKNKEKDLLAESEYVVGNLNAAFVKQRNEEAQKIIKSSIERSRS